MCVLLFVEDVNREIQRTQSTLLFTDPVCVNHAMEGCTGTQLKVRLQSSISSNNQEIFV